MAFEDLKKVLTEAPVLRLYNLETRTEVYTNASRDGLAGMLLQADERDILGLVYCVSKKITNAERNYHSSRLELMVVVWTLDRLRQLLLGINFTIVTDCQALIYLNTNKTSNPQIVR